MNDREVSQQVHLLDKQISNLEVAFKKDIERIEVARDLQAKEYERRLGELKTETERHGEIEKKVDILTSFKDNYQGKQSQIMRNTIVISIIVPLIVSLVLIIISHYWH